MFRRKVNKRYIPDYYDVIKEPMALSTLKEKINKKLYKDFPGFVHDCALVGLYAVPPPGKGMRLTLFTPDLA